MEHGSGSGDAGAGHETGAAQPHQEQQGNKRGREEDEDNDDDGEDSNSDTRWEEWIQQQQGRPVPEADDHVAQRATQLEATALRGFVLDPEAQRTTLPAVGPFALRAWLHKRADQLGLRSFGSPGGRDQPRPLTLLKPSGWRAPWEGPRAPGDASPPRPQQQDPPEQQQQQQQPKKKSRTRGAVLTMPRPAGAAPRKAAGRAYTYTDGRGRCGMEDWGTGCDECGAELDAHEALYHFDGMGPLCQACVDADPYLAGLKWEAKSEFWRY